MLLSYEVLDVLDHLLSETGVQLVEVGLVYFILDLNDLLQLLDDFFLLLSIAPDLLKHIDRASHRRAFAACF